MARTGSMQGVYAVALCAALGACDKAKEAAPEAPAEVTPVAVAPTPEVVTVNGGTEVLLCDGKTKTVVAPGTPGTAVAGALMEEWLRKNPNRNWEAEERERHTLKPAADNSDLVTTTGQQQTYGAVSPQDVQMWKLESEKLATAGSRVFHTADELGSTVGVSCDMCHPHAANTHPETYPKFQQQLGRVALLRDMINWCLEHPVRAQPMASDDPRMRALEGYILAQRKGTPLNYGKR